MWVDKFSKTKKLANIQTKKLKLLAGKIYFTTFVPQIFNKVRALENCYFIYHGARYKVLSCEILSEHGKSGEIIKADSKNGLIIATIDSAIKVLTIQPEGKQKMDAKQYMNSNKFKVGDIINNS